MGTPDLRHNLARTLRWLRFTRGWSQEVLAELSGLHRNYIGQLERQHSNIGLANLEKIAHAFGLTLGEFFAEVEGIERRLGGGASEE